LLPLINVGTEVAPQYILRENLELPDLGMPRDLTGDFVVDANDHSLDYTILPVAVRLVWDGENGQRQLVLYTLLTEFVR